MSNKTKTFPEVEALNLNECLQALIMEDVNFQNLMAEGRADCDARMFRLQERRNRLMRTADKIKRENEALRRNK